MGRSRIQRKKRDAEAAAAADARASASFVRPPSHIALHDPKFMEKFLVLWNEHIDGFSQMKGRSKKNTVGGSMNIAKEASSNASSSSSNANLPEWKRCLIEKRKREQSKSRNTAIPVPYKASVNTSILQKSSRRRLTKEKKKDRSSSGGDVSRARLDAQERYRLLKASRKKALTKKKPKR